MKNNFISIVLLILCFSSNAQQNEIALHEYFFGKYDYTAIGNTLNTAENNNNASNPTQFPCTMLTSSSATLSLGANQEIHRAYLYWAGSSTTPVYNVQLNGNIVNAQRSWTVNSNGLSFFGAFADVTPFVLFTGNGNYTFSGMDLNAGLQQYCGVGQNFGGWSIVIVYEDPTLINNIVSVYDGFEVVASPGQSVPDTLQIQLQGINVIDPQGGKIGFLAWEGDAAAATEQLLVNGNVLSNPPLNPANNVFNSTNSFTGANDLYNMDLDYFDIGNYVNPGDTTLDIMLTTTQDAVFVNNIVVVLSSELPDAAITVNPSVQGDNPCGNRVLNVNYTVSNTVDGTDILPAGIPVAFYADGVLVGTSQTTQALPVGDSQSLSASFTIPNTIPNNFQLLAVVDDTGDGTGIQQEINEDNNTDLVNVTLYDALTPAQVTDQTRCSAPFNLAHSIVTVNAAYTFSFHASSAEASSGAGAYPNSQNYLGTNGETVYVRIQDPVSSCFMIYDFQLFLNQPVINEPTIYEICSNTSSTTAEFNLNSKTNEILAGQPYTISYHESSADAQNGIDAIPELDLADYTNTSNPQTIYVRVENDLGCVVTTQFDLVVSQYPDVFQPADYEVCDDDNDGHATFDLMLPSFINEITGGAPDVIVTFYPTYADMIGIDGIGANEIENPSEYNNLAQNTQPLYIAVSSAGGACRVFTEVNLIVNPKPQITKNVPIVLQKCDDNTLFNLEDARSDFMGTLTWNDYHISYHETESEAENNQNALTNFLTYPSTSGEVWVRVENKLTGCFDVVRVELVVNPLPIVDTPQVARYILCDDDGVNDGYTTFDLQTQIAGIVNGQAGLTVTFHDLLAEAEAGINPLPYIYDNNESHTETIFVRVTNESGCYVITLMDLVVRPLPVLVDVPAPIEACDTDGNGIGVFVDFAERIEDMLNGADPNDYVITIHETYDAAFFGEYPVADITDTTYYTIEWDTQEVFLRVERIWEEYENKMCFDIYPITINVTPSPQLVISQDGTLEDITVCDENQDGQTYFDFTEHRQDILSSQANTSNLEVTYHLNEPDAIDGVLAITTIDNYWNLSNPQTIWVRLEDTATECFDVASFKLYVNLPLELPIPPDITLCDEDMDGDVEYDLTTRIADILSNAPNPNNYTVEFFTHYDYAVAGDMSEFIDTPEAYWSSLNAETLGVRVTHKVTGCESYTILNIRRASMPSVPVGPLDPMQGCEVSTNSVQGIFDLAQREDFIRGGNNNLIITYHLTPEDAESGENALPMSYTSANATIYIRVANPDDSGIFCVRVLEIDLNVNPIPVVFDNSFEVCQLGSTGYADFYLPDFNADLLGPNQSLNDFTIDYYWSEPDAENETGAINQAEPLLNQPDSQPIWVRVTYNDTGCYIIEQITLYAQEAANATQPANNEFFECDDWDGENDGFVSGIDLTAFEPQILAGTTHPYQIFYYTDAAEASIDVNRITNPANFTNTISGGQTIWVRVENSTTTAPCYELVSIELIIEQPANTNITSDNNVFCIDWGSTVSNNVVVLDSGVTEAGYTFEWYHNGVLVAGETGSTLSLSNLGEEGLYTVIAISDNGCISQVSDEFEVILSGAPEIIDIATTNAFQDQQNIIVTVQGHGEYAYQLNDGPLQYTGYFTNIPSGVHTVTVYDVASGDVNQSNSCGNDSQDNIQLIDYPRFFTPNGDGHNDYWNIVGFTEFHNAEIFIFDRYGKLLKQLNPTDRGWNGMYQGQPLPSTDYWFKVVYDEEDANNNIQRKEFKAHFSLKR